MPCALRGMHPVETFKRFKLLVYRLNIKTMWTSYSYEKLNIGKAI